MDWTSLPIPICLGTDTYKASHFLMYPKARSMVAYGEFRRGFRNSTEDRRFIFYGIRYIVQKYLLHKWSEKEVELASLFFKTQNVGHQELTFPKELFLKFIRENDGYFPIKLQAIPEGTVAHSRVPVYQITSKGEYSPLVTYLETILDQIWYPCCVATLSRKVKDSIQQAFEKSDDEDRYFLIQSRLHDFGFRGSTTLEQSIVGGISHLLNFTGSDTMPAAYFAQFYLNNGKSVGNGIPASEHSVMISWDTEMDAIKAIIRNFASPEKIFSIVMDSYDYNKALECYLPQIAEEIKARGATLVVRPDSGDSEQTVLDALKSGEKNFGAFTNSKGYKVLNNMAVIQGNSVNPQTIDKILDAVMSEGYAASNVLFGMGGALLQSVTRDTMSFVTKLCHIEYSNGTKKDVMKFPESANDKASLPGILMVKRVDGVPTVFSADACQNTDEDLLQVVYDCGPVPSAFQDDFDTIKMRIDKEWNSVPKNYDPISVQLKNKIKDWIENHKQQSEIHDS